MSPFLIGAEISFVESGAETQTGSRLRTAAAVSAVSLAGVKSQLRT